MSDLSIESLSIHADDHLASTSDVSAPIHVSTTFRYDSDPNKLVPAKDFKEEESEKFIYSRIGQPVTSRVEVVLDAILDGYSVLYGSGLSAFHAAMLHYNPKKVFIGNGYHGCHGILDILNRNYGTEVLPLDSDPDLISKGDVVHLETPVNPTGEAFDIEYFSKIAHSRGAYILVDATFAPPPLMKPFNYGVDMVMHSATKYLGGHSDLLAGVLVTKDVQVKHQLKFDRLHMGTITGSLESFLLLRSLRTYSYRIKAQCESAVKVVKYLADHQNELPALKKIFHASLQCADFVKEQLPFGGGPCFSIEVTNSSVAKAIPSKVKLFNHATSLGGAESLIEWRAMSDTTVPEDLIRISIGLENSDDLIKDLVQALSTN